VKLDQIDNADTFFDYLDGLFRLTYILINDNKDSTMSRIVAIVIAVKSPVLDAMRRF